MRLRADFLRHEVVDWTRLPWQPSPLPGVERRMLDRIGGEAARATSVVRYAPGAHFAPHEHPLGEEFLVLEGCFEDQHGRYPVGSYVRNPPGSRHTPHSAIGCTIFVKLRQFAPEDGGQCAIDTTRGDWLPGLAAGLEVQPLHRFGDEQVALVRWAPGTRFAAHRHAGGEEILVLEGVFSDEFGDYPAGTWLRSPPASEHCPFSRDGCLIWVKTGHLGRADG
ncbi:MAG: cupin domain-containing protein [Rhodocyclaceae bacterium]|nr:cupin domain-containing protein [Rhodocyclaceae bacterium]